MPSLKDIIMYVLLGAVVFIGARIAAFLKRRGDVDASGEKYASSVGKYDSTVVHSARDAGDSARESGILQTVDDETRRNAQAVGGGLSEAGRSLEAAREGLADAAKRLEELVSENSRP